MSKLCDSYTESNQDNRFFLDSTHNSLAGQTFTGNGGTLCFCNFYLYKYGSPTGNAVAQIYSHTGTFGDTGVGDLLLATSDTIDVSTLTTSPTIRTLTFSGVNRIKLINQTKYVVVLSYTGGNGSNIVYLGMDTSSASHNGNAVVYKSPNWVAYGATYGFIYDACFYVYTNNPSGNLLLMGVG